MEYNGDQADKVVLVCEISEYNRREYNVYTQKLILELAKYNYRADSQEQDQDGEYFRDHGDSIEIRHF